MGRRQKKKINLDWASKEVSGISNYSVPARNLRKTDLGAVIFGTTHNTVNECLSHQLFGLPEGHFSYIKNIREGLVLFLFNYSDRKLHGVFEAAGNGQMNIDQFAWIADEDEIGYTKFPAQVKIRVKNLCNPLSEDQFQPVIAHNYYESKHFYFELDVNQTNKLLSLFASSSSSISTKWKTLYACLPTSRVQENTVHGRQDMTNPKQASNVSYASALAGKSNMTTMAPSSQPAGKWSALFKSESGSQAGTNRYNLLNQEHEDEGDDLLQGDTCEESNWACTNEAGYDQSQTWASNHDAQANVVTNNADVFVGNTWKESDWADTNEPGFGQTWESDVNPQANVVTNNADVIVGNTWEESDWADTNEPGFDQTWASDVNPQANPAAYDADVMGGNTWEDADAMGGNSWEESNLNVMNEPEFDQTCQVEDEDGQHFAKSSSSSQPLDNSLDVDEKVEGDVKESRNNDAMLVPNRVEVVKDLQPLVFKLMKELEEMKGSQVKLIVKNNRLQQELDASKQEIQQLKTRVSNLESGSRSNVDPTESDNQLSNNLLARYPNSVFIVGGHDGSNWLPTIDSYFPYYDAKLPLSPMNFTRFYASAATLNGEIYHFGGDTVESYNPTNNQWISRPPLYWKNINVAGASVLDKLYVLGGAIGLHCSAEVEYLDTNLGKWLPARSMQSKRLAPAAAELNNVLYVSGGYDGASYTSSVERYDPREKFWCKVPNMNAKKGCHSMVVLNEKLYTVGGFSGDRYLSTVEYLDTRMGGWVEAEPMNVSRGNLGTFVFGGKMYAVGGRKENDEVSDIVECCKEGGRWEVAANLKAIGKRSHFSAFVM